MSEIADVALASFNGATNDHKLVIRTNDGLAATGTLRDRMSVSRAGDLSLYDSTGTTPKFFWDASAESLGLGTVAPNTALHVSTPTTTKSVVETTGSSSDALIEFSRGQGSGNTWSVGLDQSNASALSFAYLANGSPSLTSHSKMTLDASGNLLVGTTDPLVGSGTGNNTEGLALSAGSYGGYATFSRSGSECLNLNRKTNDGTILNLRKDGTTVGSIGTNSGYIYVGSGDVNLRFHAGADAILPSTTGGTTRSDAIDLGTSGAKFKDGHFSGTVNANSFSGDGSNLTGVGASTTFGAVGTYMMGNANVISAIPNGGTTSSFRQIGLRSNQSESATYYGNGSGNGYIGSIQSGTWRMMDTMGGHNGTQDSGRQLWVRIA
tara:strand:- start:45 stop:1181 length:1137 start_codon:yes stop_codon:yes gene_type:complete